jgi:hypothetical protein
MKLENINFYLTGQKFELGEPLSELEILDIYEHFQATIYYKSGLTDIDNFFEDKSYIDKGYVCTLISSENGISILFAKYKRSDIIDMGVCHIERSKILSYEEQPATELTVVKREETKHKAKYMGKRAFGLVSSVTRLIADEVVVVNKDKTNGSVFKLKFKNDKNIEKTIILYSSDEFKHNTSLFLNTYYKSILPNEAKTPIQENNNNCFIATACYKDIYSQELIIFRWYRDNKLSNAFIGRIFIMVYYKISPHLYERLLNSNRTLSLIKRFLDRIYIRLKSKYKL